MSNTYTIGLDYGTLSCRGIIVNTENGRIEAEAEYIYPSGVISERLPTGEILPPQYALQDPDDYLNSLRHIVPELIKQSKIESCDIKAVAIDSTSSTVIPVNKDFVPLCKTERFRNNKHAWPKLWKHHAAACEAEILTQTADRICPELLEDYGGIIGPENLLPKVMQVCNEAPDVFAATETFIEYCDYITSILAGTEIRSGALLTCKSMWTRKSGYPDKSFFRELGKQYENIPDKLMHHNGASPKIVWPGENGGTLCREMADELGLTTDTIITGAEMDAYAGIPGCGINSEGNMILMIGTSAGIMLLNREKRFVPEICAAIEDSILPGYTNYAHGLPCVGDLFGWFVQNCVPEKYISAAEQQGISIHEHLSNLASQKEPGETGLIAVEWWNGEKLNPNLSGLIVGMDLNTRPEDIYRALIEATAFGIRKVVERYRKHGLVINGITACGGIAEKNRFLIQLYSDVIGMPIKVCECTQTAALGAAMFAASAISDNSEIENVISQMAPPNNRIYTPNEENHYKYSVLYNDYMELNTLFLQENYIMARLKRNRREGI